MGLFKQLVVVRGPLANLLIVASQPDRTGYTHHHREKDCLDFRRPDPLNEAHEPRQLVLCVEHVNCLEHDHQLSTHISRNLDRVGCLNDLFHVLE